jgi:YidC/Oxa1 family membrane protein insertase
MQTPESGGSGGFEKRTLIAFALMILVWVLFTQLMPKPRRSPQGSGGQVTEQADTAADHAAPASADARGPAVGPGSPAALPSGAADRGARDSVFVNALPAEEGEITIEGPLYTAVFSSRGAVLRSMRLKKYTDTREEPVELVQQAPGALGLRLAGPEGEIDLSGTVFQLVDAAQDLAGGASGEGVEGSADGTRVLRFAAESADTGNGALRVERVYRIDPTRYDWKMELSVSGVANLRKDHHLIVGWERGIPNLERQQRLERGAKGAVALLAQELVRYSFGGAGRPGCGCASGPAARGGEQSYDGVVRWAGVRGKYFGALLIPRDDVPATFIGQAEPAADAVGMRLQLPMEFEGTTKYEFVVYAGPVDYEILKELDARLDKGVIRLVDFGAKVIAPLSKATYWFMRTVHSVLPNYGVVIIVLAIFVRVLFHPLNQRALQSQRKMQALKPELDELNKKFKDNPEQRSKKQMELYKKYGINPVGGCLPILVQLPVFYGLYNVLMNTISLRKEPFVLWMRDLAAPDKVGEIMGVPINILPILMALTMFIQQKMTPTDPRQAPMMLLMPLMMVFFFYGLPSGLVLYWTMSNALAVAQQLAMKQPAVTPELAAAGETRRTWFGRKKDA